MKIALISPKGPLYRHRGGIFKRSLRYAPLTLTTLASLVPQDLNAAISLRASCDLRSRVDRRLVIVSEDSGERIEVDHWSQLRDTHDLRLLGKLLHRFGEVRLSLMALTSGMLTFLAYGLATQGWMMYVFILANVLAYATGPALQGIVSKSSPPEVAHRTASAPRESATARAAGSTGRRSRATRAPTPLSRQMW